MFVIYKYHVSIVSSLKARKNIEKLKNTTDGWLVGKVGVQMAKGAYNS